MLLWCLLTAALAVNVQINHDPNNFTTYRILVPIHLYNHHLKASGHPPGLIQAKGQGEVSTMLSNQQLRDALNAPSPSLSHSQNYIGIVFFNRLGSGPLEHAFGRPASGPETETQ
jgi:hypothetical protein